MIISLRVPLFLCISLSLFKVLSSAKDKWTKDVAFATIRDSLGWCYRGTAVDDRGAEIVFLGNYFFRDGVLESVDGRLSRGR